MNNLTLEEKQRRVEEAKQTTQYILKESKRRDHDLAFDTAKSVLAKLNEIEIKNRCLRVKFLDWLSAKLLDWSKKVHDVSMRIDSPCIIKLPEDKTKKSPYWQSKTGKNT